MFLPRKIQTGLIEVLRTCLKILLAKQLCHESTNDFYEKFRIWATSNGFLKSHQIFKTQSFLGVSLDLGNRPRIRCLCPNEQEKSSLRIISNFETLLMVQVTSEVSNSTLVIALVKRNSFLTYVFPVLEFLNF